MKIRLVTALYVSLLVGIVYLAGQQQHHSLFSVIRGVPAGDKFGHFLLMGLFSFLLNTSLRCRTVAVCAKRLLLGSLIVVLAVTLEEVSQMFLRYRSFDPVDLLADYIGIWMFGRLALYLRGRRSLKAEGVTRTPA